MSGDFELENNDEIQGEAARFESMVKKNESKFYDVDQIRDLIDHYLGKNNISWAEKALEWGMRLHPNSSELKMARVILLYKNNKFREALKFIREIEGVEEGNAELLLYKAEIYSELDEHTKAIEAFEDAIKYANSEDLCYIYVDISAELHIVGENEKARDYLRKSIELNPYNDIAYVDLIFSYQMDGFSDDAATYFQQQIDKDPYNEKAWYFLGVALQDMELVEKAIEAYDYAIVIKEDYVEAYFQKAFAYKLLDYHKNAIQVLKEALRFDIDKPRLFYEIGESYEELNEYEKAIENYQEALKIYEEFPDAWIGIGICLGELGKGKEGLEYVKKGYNMDPDNLHYRLIYADTLGDQRHFADAEEIYEKLSEDYPNINEVWLDYSELFYKMEDLDTAISYTSEGIKNLPDDVALKFRLAGYLYEGGYLEDAKQMLHTALSENKEKANEFIEFFPILEKDANIVAIINQYQDNK
jgi:tetratricopeptide (TPR) repeat protein